jgi:succinate dehydrogenase / fumarate reductase cytochrome b subunit
MNLLLRPARSSLGKKYLMAVTGLLLTGFVVGHMSGNLLVYAGREAINTYAETLKAHPGLLWTARLGLLVIFLLHIALGLVLSYENKAARPSRYVYEGTLQANWASRHMLLTGLVLLAFVLYHLAHFTFGWVVPIDDPRDVYGMVVSGFRVWWITLSYLVAMAFLGLHLWHGGSSFLQSLGLNGFRYAKLVRAVGPVVAVAVVAGNCSIPLAVVLGIVH